MTDYERTIYCMKISPEGVFLDRNDVPLLETYQPFFAQLKETPRRPDAYAVIGNNMLLLEHFQFDNTKITRKGSEQRNVSAKTEREFSKILSHDGDFAVLDEKVEKSGSYYVDNFLTQYLEHYKKIDAYKAEMQEALQMVFQNIFMGFIIEDASSLGSVYEKNGKLSCLDLLQTKEFLDAFEKSDKLDFVLFSMTGNADNKYQSFISKSSIDNRRESQIRAKDIESFLFQNMKRASGIMKY